ncbi:MAG TPA: MnhB domain-containing protein [Verrucomicrobiae bacterium]|jgi:multisubunit Na+/H+ antiporter MnhB subunit|nr:MnhB domain-containing protein [Verrucomicrobiae bacterium]
MVAATARLYAPLIVLFALSLLAGFPSSTGIGFVAGLVVALALTLHGLVFGAGAAQRAFPPWACRVFVALGLVAACAGAGLPGLSFAGRLVEAGVFTLTVGGLALMIAVLFGRVPSLRDGEW